MKNEGWGFKEDQIPSSSHLLHQTMGSRLHFPSNLQKDLSPFRLVYTWLILSVVPQFVVSIWMSELCAQLVSCKRILCYRLYFSTGIVLLLRLRCVRHVLGTCLLQKCLRHSPLGVVYMQVRNLKELTEGHHKNAWSMWLNLTQRGKSYRVRTHWGLTGDTLVNFD